MEEQFIICPECNSERIESGKITSQYGVVFQVDSSAFINFKKVINMC